MDEYFGKSKEKGGGVKNSNKHPKVRWKYAWFTILDMIVHTMLGALFSFIDSAR
jgi:hypothetical protein